MAPKKARRPPSARQQSWTTTSKTPIAIAASVFLAFVAIAIAGKSKVSSAECPAPDAPWAERDAWRATHPVQSARSPTSSDELTEWQALVAAGNTFDPVDTPAAAGQMLGIACAAGDLAAVQRAVAGGADVAAAVYGDSGHMSQKTDRATGGTSTAALVAALNGHAAVLRFLLAVGRADPNAGDTHEGTTYVTPTHAACDRGHADCVRVALAFGADASIATTMGGRTPAMLAAMRGHVDCLRALGEGATGGGADGGLRLSSVNAVNEYGRTALDYAEMRRRTEAAAFLRDELGARKGSDLAKSEAAFAADVKK